MAESPLIYKHGGSLREECNPVALVSVLLQLLGDFTVVELPVVGT